MSVDNGVGSTPRSVDYEAEGPKRLKKKPTEDSESPLLKTEQSPAVKQRSPPVSPRDDLPQANLIQSKDIEARRRTIVRRIIAVSVSFVFLIAAMQGLAVLQSSLNQEIGVWGLCSNFASVVISCLFFSTFIVQRLGCKWAMVLGMACMMTWMLANLYPHWGTLLPGSVIMGFGWAPLWTAQCTFFTISGVEIAKLTHQMPDQIIARGFGFFFMAFMTGPVWGNLISSGILSQAKRSSLANSSIQAVTPSLWSDIVTPVTSDPLEDTAPVLQCGAGFCPQVLKSFNGTAIQKPPQKLLFILVGVYLVLSALAVLIIILFVPNLNARDDPRQKGETQKAKLSLKHCAKTLKQLTNKLQLLMVPLNVYIGLEEGFTMVEYTVAFVTCSIGMSAIGFVVISYAITAAIISFTSGHMIRLIGRPPVFAFAFASHIGCNIALMMWKPGMGGMWVFFVFAAVWGIGDAIMQTQTNAFYGLVFSEASEAAFSNYRMWEAFGIIVSLSYSSYLCIITKLYILITVLIVGIICYTATEIVYRRQLSAQKALEDEALKTMSEEDQNEAADTVEELPSLSRKGSSVFLEYANMVRRKSIVVIPEHAVKIAAALMRQNSDRSLGDEDEEIRRKLTTFAPQMEDDGNEPRRKVSESAVYRKRKQDNAKANEVPRRTTVHEMPNPEDLEVPKRLERINEI